MHISISDQFDSKLLGTLKSEFATSVLFETMESNQKPDLILLDLSSNYKFDMFALLKRLTTETPSAKVILILDPSTKYRRTELMQSGALGFVSKTSAMSVVKSCFDTVLSGKVYEDSSISDFVF